MFVYKVGEGLHVQCLDNVFMHILRGGRCACAVQCACNVCIRCLYVGERVHVCPMFVLYLYTKLEVTMAHVCAFFV